MARVSHLVLPIADLHRSRQWYVTNLGFTVERERDDTVGIKDQSGLMIFLVRSAEPLAGQKITLTIQVDDVHARHGQLVALGVKFVSPPQRQSWGYGAEVLDPDGYLNHLWDEVSMARAMREMTETSG